MSRNRFREKCSILNNDISNNTFYNVVNAFRFQNNLSTVLFIICLLTAWKETKLQVNLIANYGMIIQNWRSHLLARYWVPLGFILPDGWLDFFIQYIVNFMKFVSRFKLMKFVFSAKVFECPLFQLLGNQMHVRHQRRARNYRRRTNVEYTTVVAVRISPGNKNFSPATNKRIYDSLDIV